MAPYTHLPGGETRIGPNFSDDLQRNARAGLTLVFPVMGRHALRAGFSTGISTRSGSDFEIYTLGAAYAREVACSWPPTDCITRNATSEAGRTGTEINSG